MKKLLLLFLTFMTVIYSFADENQKTPYLNVLHKVRQEANNLLEDCNKQIAEIVPETTEPLDSFELAKKLVSHQLTQAAIKKMSKDTLLIAAKESLSLQKALNVSNTKNRSDELHRLYCVKLEQCELSPLCQEDVFNKYVDLFLAKPILEGILQEIEEIVQ